MRVFTLHLYHHSVAWKHCDSNAGKRPSSLTDTN